MKKAGGMVFWIAASAAFIFLAYTLYIQLKPSGLKVLPGNEETGTQQEETGGETGQKESEPDGKQEKKASMAPGFELVDLDGTMVKLSDYRGKVVFLNFWALSCPQCINELPDLEEAHRDFADSGNSLVLTVNLGDDPERVKKYYKDNELTLPVLLDSDEQVGRIYGVRGIPITFVINTDGTAYGYVSGAVSSKTLLKIAGDLKG